MRLFDDTERTETSESRHQESTYDFLDRTADPAFARVRMLLGSWFGHLPEAGQLDVRRRLGKDRAQFAGAFFEMYLHELHLRLGYDIVVHPELPSGEGRPDFLVARAGHSHYLEATVVGPTTDQAHANRLDRIVDSLDRLDGKGFGLLLAVESEGPSSPSVRGLRRDLERWLASLNAEKERARQARGAGLQALQRREWSAEGWRLSFQAWPLAPDRPTRGAILAHSGGGGVFDDPATIRNAAEYKAKRYRGLDRPLVLAMHLDLMTANEEDIAAALYGPRIGRLVEGDAPHVEPTGRGHGFWRGEAGPRNLHVRAVLTWSIELRPWSVTRQTPTVWTAPGQEAEAFPPLPPFDPTEAFELPDAEVFDDRRLWPGQPFRDQ